MDEQAFQALYEKTSRSLWAYLARVSGRGDVADDILQETFFRFLVRNPPAMDSLSVRTYLFRIATNLLHDRWRRNRNAKSLETIEHGFTYDAEAHLDIHRVMRQLRPRERELLWLAYVEGLNHAEIASITGLSAISIRLLLFRARRKAAALLRPEMVKI